MWDTSCCSHSCHCSTVPTAHSYVNHHWPALSVEEIGEDQVLLWSRGSSKAAGVRDAVNPLCSPTLSSLPTPLCSTMLPTLPTHGIHSAHPLCPPTSATLCTHTVSWALWEEAIAILRWRYFLILCTVLYFAYSWPLHSINYVVCHTTDPCTAYAVVHYTTDPCTVYLIPFSSQNRCPNSHKNGQCQNTFFNYFMEKAFAL